MSVPYSEERRVHLYSDNSALSFKNGAPGNVANTLCRGNYSPQGLILTGDPRNVTCTHCLREMAKIGRAAPADSCLRTPQIRTTAMPTDLNPYGGVFGGWLMAQMALGAGSLASRTAKAKAVVVHATDLTFPGTMQTGDELSVYCDHLETGRTSMTIGAQGVSRTRNSEKTIQVCTGTFKFVALDEHDKPLPIPRQGQ